MATLAAHAHGGDFYAVTQLLSRVTNPKHRCRYSRARPKEHSDEHEDAVLAATAAPAASPRVLPRRYSASSTAVQQDRARRRTHLLLSDLEDHILDDIGVDPSHVRGTRPGAVDWVVQSHSGTARLVFIGR